MIHVYAFASRLDRLPELTGVGGATLEQRTLDDVAAVVSRHAAPPDGDPGRDAVAHGLVVEALAALATVVLPVRFGETFRDDAALELALRDRIHGIRRALERVDGCVEIGVRVVGSTLPRAATAPATGTGYMQERLAELAEHDAIVNELHRRLDALSRTSVETSRGGFDAAYLIERASVEGAQAAVRQFADAHPELTVVCTGPWAPYSFGGAQP